MTLITNVKKWTNTERAEKVINIRKKEISQKAFGIKRAEMAKERIKNSQQHLEKRQDFVSNSQARLEASRTKIKQMLEEKKISEEDANARFDRIDQMQERLKQHESKIREVREKVALKRAEIDKQEEKIETIEE